MACEPPAIAILHVCSLSPCSSTHAHSLFLSTTDIFSRWLHYNQRLLFYNTREDEYSGVIERLKGSLSRALAVFFPWAGRLVEGQSGRLSVDCNDAGVEFVEASIDLPFSELQKDGFQMKPFFRNLARLGEHLTWDDPQLPLLSIQVTRFVGGGIAIGCAQSHVIADGHSFWHFMNSWSECARDVPISLPPLHMRTALLPASLTLEEAEKFPSPVASGKEFIIKRSTEDLAESVFHFTASTIRKLKNLALQHGLATSFTSFEVLCAHVWKHVTKARQLNGAQKVRCFFLLNTRSRLNPPLPDGYFGNALCRGSALTTAAELVGESLAATAARIHQNIVAYDDGTIRRELEEVEKFDPSMFPKLSKSNEEANQWSVNVASSPRFRVYETDFGWGRPEAVRPAWIRVDGEMVLFAGREGEGSVDVCLGLSPQTMQTLLQDHHFLWFTKDIIRHMEDQ